MRVIHSMVIREKPPSKRPHIQSRILFQYHAFSFISTILNSDRFTAEEKASVQAEALRNLQVRNLELLLGTD